jgi:polyisoprenoid-binding protein YceI
MRGAGFVALVLLSVCMLLPHSAARADAPPGARAVDTAKSKATFSIQHVFVEHVGGTMPIAGGYVVLQPGSAIPLSASAELDAAKVDTGDSDRDESLRSPDFFDVKRFPQWTFASTRIVPRGTAAFEMDGTLTVHGVAQPERLDVAVSGDAVHPVYHAVGHIDRRAFGMAVTRLDGAIGGSADVTLDIALK